VENMHYERRKQIVEYDDVANEQRKIIYRFRNQLLDSNYDISAKVDEIRAEYIQNTLNSAGIFEGGAREDFNLELFFKGIHEKLNLELNPDDYKDLDYEELYEAVLQKIKEVYEEKMSVVDAETRGEVEREVYLKILDKEWRDHLYLMDTMKTGIRLRAYNQKDPLVEYKKESFNLFAELINEIKTNTIIQLQVIQFRVEDPEEEARKLAERMETERKIQEAVRQFNHATDEEENNSEKKVARNDPCPCGSGKKYKQCFGKSGPKKGAFAS
jgi:preprotein translocase subunit SecA